MTSGRGARVVVVGLAVLAASVTSLTACPDFPEPDTLTLNGKLEREGVEETNLALVDVAFESDGARGEWWNCELRLTASSCVGQHHVNVWLGMPGTESFDDVGQTGCVDTQGNAFGAFELLTLQLDQGERVLIPQDLTALIIVGSDVDADGSANLENDEEVTAAAKLVEGEVSIISLGDFDDPVSLRITGTTTTGESVEIEVNGPTQPVLNPPPFDVARTCVAN